MHGKTPRLRAHNRSKYRSLTPQQQCEAALELIQPTSGLRAECEATVAAYIKIIQRATITESQWLADQKQGPYDKLIKKLYAVEVAGANHLSKSLLKKIKTERRFLEAYLAGLRAQHQHGGGHRSLVKVRATINAWALLERYGHTVPTLTEGGTWHKLAAVLFGCAEVDAFNFDYLKRFWSHTQKRKAAQV